MPASRKRQWFYQARALQARQAKADTPRLIQALRRGLPLPRTPGIAPSQSPLLELPQEILEMVLRYAYCENRLVLDIPHVNHRWDRKNQLGPLLVSKEFFDKAIKVFIQTSTFSFNPILNKSYDFLERSIAGNLRKLSVAPRDFDRRIPAVLNSGVDVRFLEVFDCAPEQLGIQFFSQQLHALRESCDVAYILSGQDLAGLRLITHLVEVSTLRDINVRLWWCRRCHFIKEMRRVERSRARYTSCSFPWLQRVAEIFVLQQVLETARWMVRPGQVQELERSIRRKEMEIEQLQMEVEMWKVNGQIFEVDGFSLAEVLDVFERS